MGIKYVMLLFCIVFGLVALPSFSALGQNDFKFDNTFITAYANKEFEDDLIMEWGFPEVSKIQITIKKDSSTIVDESTTVINKIWSYEKDISNWETGEYNVKLVAYNKTNAELDQTSFNIKIKGKEIFDSSFDKKYEDKIFTDELKITKTFPLSIKEVVVIVRKDNKVKLNETSQVDTDGKWSYKKDIGNWDRGDYKVELAAYDSSGNRLDITSFDITLEQAYNMPLFCSIMFIIFIILAIVFFIISLLKNKKILRNLKFNPKDVLKKLPVMAYISMFIMLLLIIGWTSICMTAGLNLGIFLVFLLVLGLAMLLTYWTFSNRNPPFFILYLIFSILSLIVISLSAVWSNEFAFGLIVTSGLLICAYIIYFIFMLIYWLTSRRGILIALITVILALVFMILQIIFIVLAILIIIPWSVPVILGSLLLLILLFLTWVILREDLFYFETRQESKTHRGTRMTFNMFDIISTPRGIFKRDYDRKVMGKISYEHTHDKNVRLEVISLRDWDSAAGRSQGRRLMGVYTRKMRSKEGPPFNKESVAKGVKYTIYNSDINLDDKMELCKSFGFEVEESGRERGLDYFDLELVHRPFLGLGTPMGSQKKKKDYDKDSGYVRDSEKEDRERDHRYDYEHERERQRKDEDLRRRAEQEREREKYRERDPDEDLEDWSRTGRTKDRPRREERRDDSYYGSGYDDYKSDRARRHEREPPPEKPKKRPPPPRIVGER